MVNLDGRLEMLI